MHTPPMVAGPTVDAAYLASPESPYRAEFTNTVLSDCCSSLDVILRDFPETLASEVRAFFPVPVEDPTDDEFWESDDDADAEKFAVTLANILALVESFPEGAPERLLLVGAHAELSRECTSSHAPDTELKGSIDLFLAALPWEMYASEDAVSGAIRQDIRFRADYSALEDIHGLNFMVSEWTGLTLTWDGEVLLSTFTLRDGSTSSVSSRVMPDALTGLFDLWERTTDVDYHHRAGAFMALDLDLLQAVDAHMRFLARHDREPLPAKKPGEGFWMPHEVLVVVQEMLADLPETTSEVFRRLLPDWNQQLDELRETAISLAN